MITTRAATLADLTAIISIYNDAVLTTNATFDTQPRTLAEQQVWLAAHGAEYPVLVAEVDGVVAGWASLSRWSPKLAYSGTTEISLYVHGDYRGRGVGKALMAAILVAGQSAGFHTVLARIVEGNGVSVRLHEAFGFELVGIMREVGYKFGRWLDVLLMQKLFEPDAPTL